MDPPASREISLTVRWLCGLSSWLEQQRLMCVDVFISMRTASAAACQDACRLFRTTSSLLMLFFVQPWFRNCYKLQSVVTFTFMQTSTFCILYWTASNFGSKMAHLLDATSKFALFSVFGLTLCKKFLSVIIQYNNTGKVPKRIMGMTKVIARRTLIHNIHGLSNV